MRRALTIAQYDAFRQTPVAAQELPRAIALGWLPVALRLSERCPMISPQSGCSSKPTIRFQRSILVVGALALVFLMGDPHGFAQSPGLPVFPGAQGFGSTTRAAYGGSVAPVILRVTNRNDSGAGSLRAALTDPRPRVVIFEVSGTIALQSIINIMSPYLTVAGATAPSPGISVRDDAIQVTDPRCPDPALEGARGTPESCFRVRGGWLRRIHGLQERRLRPSLRCMGRRWFNRHFVGTC